jgi:hypothetical protein
MSSPCDHGAPKNGWPTDHPAVYALDSTRLADTLEEFVLTMYESRFPDLMEQMGLATISANEVYATARSMSVTLSVTWLSLIAAADGVSG